jgi:uncharacterized membrane protein
VSAHGEVVVGTTGGGNSDRIPFRWTQADGLVQIGNPSGYQPFGGGESAAYAVSADGNVLVGSSAYGSNPSFAPRRGWRWTQAGGFSMMSLIQNPNQGQPSDQEQNMRAVSADGSLAFGCVGTYFSLDPQGNRNAACAWTGISGPSFLSPPGNPTAVQLVGASADGGVAAGTATVGAHNVAYKWGGASPGPLAGTDSQAWAISADGSTVVGTSYGATAVACRWTADGQRHDLGGNSDSAYGVSGDGSVVVGRMNGHVSVQTGGFIWSASSGLRDLANVMSEGGAPMAENGGGSYTPRAISADGTTVVGGSYSGRAWVAILPPKLCYANCDDSTVAPILNVADFSCFLAKYAAADPYANCDASTTAPVLNVNDFTCFLTKYAAGCP